MSAMAIRSLRRRERLRCDRTDWLDVQCRDRQIDTKTLMRLIKNGKVEVPKRFKLRQNKDDTL